MNDAPILFLSVLHATLGVSSTATDPHEHREFKIEAAATLMNTPASI